ncbi:unnamed protein product [Spirodela intermedia]|uniref:Uncharacterized protein n=1 Tax=Spirodela intermedia TaxID=51605 RepID=A0A7I8J6J2_SPIIN|nr:unnamed protein product [Spirodela intermedia]CAA6665858.1 unnamed protein product [Spirodela intermedia]
MLYCASPSLSAAYSVPHSFDFSVRKSLRLRDRFFHRIHSGRRSAPVASVKIGVEEIADLVQNKVLISATLACTIGQLSKPFTSALSGNGIDFGAAIRSGGMPSSHSAGVMAATTCLGLERGFSDPIFGMSAVFATFVMYDAQGVRREVGKHAKNLNKITKHNRERSILLQEKQSPIDCRPSVSLSTRSLGSLSSPEQADGYELEQEVLPRSGRGKSSNPPPAVIVGDGSSEKTEIYYSPLEESVGHTEVQVIAGALLGFLVSLAVEAII